MKAGKIFIKGRFLLASISLRQSFKRAFHYNTYTLIIIHNIIPILLHKPSYYNLQSSTRMLCPSGIFSGFELVLMTIVLYPEETVCQTSLRNWSVLLLSWNSCVQHHNATGNQWTSNDTYDGSWCIKSCDKHTLYFG